MGQGTDIAVLTRSSARQSRRARVPAAVAAVALGLLIGGGLAGCGDDAPPSGERHTAPEHSGAHNVKWLEVASTISPAQWLASRGADEVLPLSDPEVKRIDGVLGEAHRHYRESERMIANRSAQLSEMLKSIQIEESASAILDDLTEIGVAAGRTEGFGAISQYYFNLRAAGTSRTDSLKTLKSRYGSKS